MSYARHDFIIAALAVIVTLFVVGAGLASAVSVIYRSVLMRKEIATRRVLGARRSHIVAMFVLEGALGLWIGVLLGAAAVLALDGFFPGQLSTASVMTGAVLLLCSGAGGGWLAARHASRTSFRHSGLFDEPCQKWTG
jgi:ABC-type antimicrobial peptide transport system permease subunit